MKRASPHRGVSVRLGPSRIHGIGVIAIVPIPKHAHVFPGDDEELVWIDQAIVKKLRPSIRRLYEDFCVSKNAKYGCPDSFNHLTPAWYLNHSDHPNVEADKDYRFFALRNIAPGEELTVDYSTYIGDFDGSFAPVRPVRRRVRPTRYVARQRS